MSVKKFRVTATSLDDGHRFTYTETFTQSEADAIAESMDKRMMAKVMPIQRMDETTRLREQLAIALAGINETIEDNLHLADGDNCTLIKLKQALTKIREMGDV